MRASRTLLAVAVLLGAWGCSYTYRNPAEQLGPGEVGGRTVAGAGVVVDGVAVSVKGGELDARSRSNGRFAMLPLPVGRHTLVFRKGQDRAVQRVVDVALGKDGQPQGVWLGDVEIPAAVAVAGEIALPGGAPLPDNGVVVDETSGATASVRLAADGRSGSFFLTGLSVGTHRLRVSAGEQTGPSAWVAGPIDVTFSRRDAGAVKRLARLTLRNPTPATAPVTLRLAIVGSTPGLQLSDLAVNGLGQPVTVGPDGYAQVRLAEGRWTVTIEPLVATTGVVTPPPVSFVAVAGATIDLGTLYTVAQEAAARALSACHEDPDCAPSGTCSGGTCRGWTPPAQAPASVPYCDATLLQSGTCQPGAIGAAPVSRVCLLVGTTPAVVPCGSCCTPDGVQVGCALPGGVEGCPAPPPVVYAYTISGRVTGAVTSGVQIMLVGADRSTTTDANGAYTFTGIAPGTYEVSPYLTGYDFTPPYQMVTVRTASVTVPDFVASVYNPGATYQLSGTISNTGGAGVIVTLDAYSDHRVTVTDATGSFHFSNLPAGTYTVTPDLTTLSFTPVNQTVTISGNETMPPFTAAQTASYANVCGLPGTGGWLLCVENPLPTGDYVLGMWGAAANDVWMVGTGRPLHWDGFSWNATPGPIGRQAVRGSSATDVWTVGGDVNHWDGISWTTISVPGYPSLHDVWALSTTLAWTVGDNGASARWDGSAWTVEPTNTTLALDAVWGFAANDVWAAGANGTMLHWDGSVWTSVDSGTQYGIVGLWGSAPNDVWAAGPYATMQHWDGATWTTIVTPSSATPTLRVWGFAANDVWASGYAGQVLHWNGTSWTMPVTGTSTAYFTGLWGSAPNDLWAVSTSPGSGNAALLHWDGTSFTNRASGTSLSDFTAAWESPLGHLMVIRREPSAGVAAYQWFDGTSWHGGLIPSPELDAVWGTSDTDAWAVGRAGRVWRWDGSSWSPSPAGVGADLFGVWGSASNDVWAVGDLATLLHWDGAVWTTVAGGTATTIFHGVWGAAANDVWAVGADGGAPMLVHWDGTSWSAPYDVSTNALYGVWGSGSTDVWAVGLGPDALHWDGTLWNYVPIPSAILTGISRFGGSPYPWAVGYGGAILVYDGTAWSTLDSGTTQLLNGVTDSYAVGNGGTLLRAVLP